MAVTGAISDRFLTLFNDNLLVELQQEGSRLGNIFRRETMKGQKSYFDKIGKTTARQKTSRHQVIVPATENYERRLITFETLYDAHILDINDLMDMVADPTSEILRNMSMALGREMDRIIISALTAATPVQSNGSTTNTSLPAGQLVAVSDITFDLDLSAGDKGLTPGKLDVAIKKLQQNFAPGDYVVIAPAGQLANLRAHTRASSHDFMNTKPLMSAALDQSLSGYRGMQYVMYEETGIDGNSDENVFVVAREAVKLGVRKELQTLVEQRADMIGSPTQLQSLIDLGATRMFEEAVVQIACDPRKG